MWDNFQRKETKYQQSDYKEEKLKNNGLMDDLICNWFGLYLAQ